MICKFHTVETERIPCMGSDVVVNEHHYCKLKLAGESERLEIYLRLEEMGLEVSMVTDECPLAATKNWTACPYHNS